MKKNTLFFLLLFVAILSLYIINITPKNEVQLGKKLFFEKDFSKDKTMSCASCHQPKFAFANNQILTKGVNGNFGKRNVPTVMNLAQRELLFYDGRAKNLEDQIHFPIEDTNELDFNLDAIVHRLNQQKKYKFWFKKIYKSKPNKQNIIAAIVAYEKTLETSNSVFDNYMNGKIQNIDASIIRGRKLFNSKRINCVECHFGTDFTGDEFINIGLYNGKEWNDVGRFAITNDSADLGKFKVPQLRNIAITAPYMHNGKIKTLKDVIEYYNNPKSVVKNAINMDIDMQPKLNLTAQEKIDLENFLRSLTDTRFL